ncbi:MAG: polyamine aminopropyltransferase [Rhodospirillales bacterium]|nr:polyamine aminopropyltransferase [Rhodospirillales bacterium]
MSDRWIEEKIHDGIITSYRADTLYFETGTGHQHLAIFEHAKFGKMLTLDGIAQLAERDEFIYHEMMAHVPILAHGAAKSVLIIGGGDGGMLRRVLMHPGVEKATMVEIDPAVTEMCLEHFPDVSNGAFEDPRTNLVYGDGAAFVHDSADRFDVIIVDSTDPIGPAEVLFTREFYTDCKAHLNEGGVLVIQSGLPFMQPWELTATAEHFRALFAAPSAYIATIPSYIGGNMVFGWGSDDPSLLDIPVETLRERFNALDLNTRYYTPEFHKAAFILPVYLRELTE